MSNQGVTHRVDGNSLVQHQGQIVRLVGFIDTSVPQNKHLASGSVSSTMGNNVEIALSCPSASPAGTSVDIVPVNNCKIATNVLQSRVLPELQNSSATSKPWFEFIVRVGDGGDLSVMILDVVNLPLEENEELNVKGVVTLSVVSGNLPELFG